MFRSSILTAIVALGGSAALAQDAADVYAAGRDEYLVACSACHGEAADGKGELATMFTTQIPDLTGISLRNDGVFPMLRVIQTIDGRAVIVAHGNPMPLFGSRFSAEADSDGAVLGAEAIARGRVLELALYIQSIQQ